MCLALLDAFPGRDEFEELLDVIDGVDRARSYGQDLNSVHVMFVVLVDAAPAEHFASFWQQVQSEFSGSAHHFVMLFVGDDDTAFPPGVTELPPPRFDRDDLRAWAAGAGNGSELDVGMVYEASLCGHPPGSMHACSGSSRYNPGPSNRIGAYPMSRPELEAVHCRNFAQPWRLLAGLSGASANV